MSFLFWLTQEPGHILPTLPLALQLQERGHHVAYGAAGRVGAELNRWGIGTIDAYSAFDPQLLEMSLLERVNSGVVFESKLRSECSSDEDYYARLRRCLTTAIEILKPKVVVLDGIKDWRLLRGDPLFFQGLFPRLLRLCVHFRPIATWEVEVGAPRILVLCSDAFELPELLNKSVTYGDAGVAYSLSAADHQRTNPDRRPEIYVTFGSQIATYPLLTDVLTRILRVAENNVQWNFIVNVDPLRLNAQLLSQNVRFASNVTYLEDLKATDVCISHGGLGTIRDCIYLQKPMLVIPQMWDQEANGRRVVRHNVGRVLVNGPAVTAKLPGILKELLEAASVRSALTQMRRSFAENSSFETARKLCEALAAT